MIDRIDKRLMGSLLRKSAIAVIASVGASAFIIWLISLAGIRTAEQFPSDLALSIAISFTVAVLVAPAMIYKIMHMAQQLSDAKAELEHQANTDHLTGMRNRRGFEAAAQQLIGLAQSHQQPVSLIACDIDHFKAVNDTHGHKVGDDVICAVATAAGSTLEGVDGLEFVAGRVGGEEYAFIIKGLTQRPLIKLADRIRHACHEADVTAQDGPVRVTVSAGAAIMSHHDAELGALMLSADRALYRAKEGGRDRVEWDRSGETVAHPVSAAS